MVPARVIAVPPVPFSGQRRANGKANAGGVNFHTLIGVLSSLGAIDGPVPPRRDAANWREFREGGDA